MQLNIASPFFDKYWNISRNHTSFFPRWWSNTSPNLRKKYQLLFILHVRSAIQTLQMGAWYVFLHYRSVFGLQGDLPSVSRFYTLFQIHYGSEGHLFQKQQLSQCQVNALITQLNQISTFLFPSSVSFMLGKSIRKATEYMRNTFLHFFFQLGSGFSLYPSQWIEKFKERHWISWKNFSLKGIYFNGARISVSAKYARMYLTSNLYLNHVDFKRT